jgi:cytidylate kinase
MTGAVVGLCAWWARERDARREGGLALHVVWQKEQRDARDGLKAHLWLPADVSRRLRAVAARTGLQLEHVLSQLADQVRLNDNSTLTVGTFTPD